MQTTSKSVFYHNIAWADFTSMAAMHPCLANVSDKFNLKQYDSKQNTAALLNHLARDFQCVSAPEFVDQEEYTGDPRYYEQIISEDSRIPTRAGSWHDFFNGLIWLQFPDSKRALNRMHMQDIIEFGVNPRTARRNRITHFDECGLVLVCQSERTLALLADLANHRWEEALYANKDCWHTDIKPWVFGHANLEMLLNPFLQLTAKWLVVEASPDSNQQHIDRLLQQRLLEPTVFEQKGTLKPLPLLGIPGWHEKQSRDFYADTAVFRPLRRSKR